MFSEKFIKEAKELYPNWTDLHNALDNNSGIIGRYLDDSAPSGIGYNDILKANSLEELKAKALIIKRKNDLYRAYMTGECYENDSIRKEELGCPRIYAQMSMDSKALDAFKCYGVFTIPKCPKFKTGECWERFEKLGLKFNYE